MHNVGHLILAYHNDSLDKCCEEETKAVDNGQILKTYGVFDLELSTGTGFKSKKGVILISVIIKKTAMNI